MRKYVIRSKIRSPNKALQRQLKVNSDIARFTYNWLLANKVNLKEARNNFRIFLVK